MLFLLIPASVLLSQAPDWASDDYEVKDNLDTVLIHRKVTPWWFGMGAGATFGMSFNKLYLPDILDENGGLLNTKLIKFNKGNDYGYFVGLYGEYLPVDEMWGYALRINFADYRKTTSYSDYLGDSLNTRYANTNKFNYITFSPSVRYNLPIKNLFLYAGADLEFNVHKEILKRKEFDNSAAIAQDMIMPTEPNKFRAAFHFGFGYDIWLLDIKKKALAFVSPYVTFHIGTHEISENNSKRIPFLMKVGANIKFNINKCTYDTLQLDKNFIEAPEYAATYRKEEGSNFPGFIERKPQISSSLREIPAEEQVYAELNPTKPEIPADTSAPIIETKSNVRAEAKTQEIENEKKTPKAEITINPSQKKTIYYKTSTDAQLDKVTRNWLDALAGWMANNPHATLRITGHSDNAGTTVQNQQRSENRATAVVQYLMKKGVTRRRLLDRGRGALEPVADNTTEKGRSRNRRVEIQIVK